MYSINMLCWLHPGLIQFICTGRTCSGVMASIIIICRIAAGAVIFTFSKSGSRKVLSAVGIIYLEPAYILFCYVFNYRIGMIVTRAPIALKITGSAIII